MICNPHNPIGRCWTRGELEQLSDLCERYEIFTFSDEIHGDMIMPGYSFTPFVTLNCYTLNNSMIFCSPSKTFNLAVLSTAYTILPNVEARKKYWNFIKINHQYMGNIFGTLALKHAYTEAAPWKDEIILEIHKNASKADSILLQNDLIQSHPFEATY